MINIRTKLISLLASLVLLLGCDAFHQGFNTDNDKSVINGVGEVNEKNIHADHVTELELRGVIDLHITYGSTQKFTIQAQQNILDIISTEETGNNILKVGIDDKYEIKNSKGVILNITTPDTITRISVMGTSNIQFHNGKSSTIRFDIQGVGNIDFNDYSVDKCYLNVSGVANCLLRVNSLLNVQLQGVGSVLYKGSPKVEQSISGVWTLQKSAD